MAWVYILKTDSGKYYIGSTENLEMREKYHKAGNTPSTKRLGATSIEIVFSQQYDSLHEARSIERRLKKLKRRDYIEKIIREGIIRIKPR